LAFGSLLALLCLRLYAAFETTPIRTPWDDDHLRSAAMDHARAQTSATAIHHLTLPWSPPVFEGRLNGYDAWLVAGLKAGHLVGSYKAELSFQLVNTFFLLVQTVVVLLFARWATRDWSIAATFAFLHMSAPIVFGMSRWILTENPVLVAGPMLAFLSAWLLAMPGPAGSHVRARHILRAGLAAYGMALCCSAREYAAPTFMVMVGATLFGLLVRKRWREAEVVALVTTAFVIPWLPSLLEAIEATIRKGGQSEYFHTMSEWIPHVAFYTVGPSLTFALTALLAVVVVQGWRRAIDQLTDVRTTVGGVLRNQLSGLRIAAWAHWALMGFYVAGILWTRNRVTRPAIMPMFAALGIVLIGFRAHPLRRRWLRDARIKWTAVGLIAISWCVLLFQLLVAFDGGKTYAHAGFRLEYFNYPLHLRKLNGPDDNYICNDQCPYDRR
jgi:Dolichyl-phosphate-mannose-protein mannosyltransferase.